MPESNAQILQKKFFLFVQEKQEGPFSIAQVLLKLRKGEIDRSTPVWYEGLENWITIGDLAEFDRREPIKVPSTLPQSSGPTQIWVHNEGKMVAMEITKIAELVKQRDFRRATTVFDDEKDEWVRADQHPALLEVFSPLTPPVVPESPPKDSETSVKAALSVAKLFTPDINEFPIRAINLIQFDSSRVRLVSRRYGRLLHAAPHSLLSSSRRKLLGNKAAVDLGIRFVRKHESDLLDELRKGQIAWENEYCKLFFSLMQEKFGASTRSTLFFIFFLHRELNYFDYQASMNLRSPNTLKQLLHHTVNYDLSLHETHKTDSEHIKRYCSDNKIKIPFLTQFLSTLPAQYERARAHHKLKPLENETPSEKTKAVQSNGEKWIPATAEAFSQLAQSHRLNLETDAYLITTSDHGRESKLDTYYRKHFLYALISVFGDRCAKCGGPSPHFELEHFWLPKARGGNLMMRSRAGHYVNNGIPLCRSCHVEKEKVTLLEFFDSKELDGLLTQSQSFNQFLNVHMADYEDEDFGPLRRRVA